MVGDFIVAGLRQNTFAFCNLPYFLSFSLAHTPCCLRHDIFFEFAVGPKKITFYLSEPIKRKIYFAETSLGDQILASDTHIMEFKDYGKHFITFNKLSPDSYVQMSMMLAYYRLYGRFVCAYEPVLTKGFYHGRTEAMRPATIEAKRFCEVFCDPSSSTEEKLGALRNATITHSKLVRECAQGKGVDRHLFALKCIAEKNGLPIPEFFRSESWSKLNHTILSTSNCGNPSLALFGFGPVVSTIFL
jgi:carnitine O-acetyltransferase